jgi:SOS-response transcriptional repressor LexA
MTPLSKTQHETLIFIQDFRQKFGYMPSHHDLADGLNIKVGGSTHQRLAHLIKKGYLTKSNGPRSYELIQHETNKI